MVKQTRLQIIDSCRGIAIVMMFIYHFCFDLDFFAFIDIDMNHDPFWLNFRTLIVSSFLLLVGISFSFASQNKINRSAFLKRLGLLVFYAALVSGSSYLMYPKSMIFFGILHFIALASILGLLFYKLYWLNLLFGLALIVISLNVNHTFFDQSAWQWFGLMTYKPYTEDYVPLLPWFGLVLCGMFIGKYLYLKNKLDVLKQWSSKHILARSLSFAGRYSIHIYMIHQPLFIGLLYVIVSLR